MTELQIPQITEFIETTKEIWKNTLAG
jgi:hypothetical protein